MVERNSEANRKKERNNDALSFKNSNQGKDLAVYTDGNIPSFAREKSERIARAIYAVTDRFPENEPLRLELRRVAVALVTKNADKAFEKDTLEESDALLSELLSLWSLTFYGSYVGNGNFEILKREIVELRALFQSANGHTEDAVFSEDFFSVTTARPPLPLLTRTEERDKGQYELTDPKGQNKNDVKQGNDKNGEGQRRMEPQQKKIFTASSKSRRKDTIVEFIRKEGDVCVKDVARAVRGLSEKTLQRELTALVASGVLQKTGDRRWSRYSLK